MDFTYNELHLLDADFNLLKTQDFSKTDLPTLYQGIFGNEKAWQNVSRYTSEIAPYIPDFGKVKIDNGCVFHDTLFLLVNVNYTETYFNEKRQDSAVRVLNESAIIGLDEQFNIQKIYPLRFRDSLKFNDFMINAYANCVFQIKDWDNIILSISRKEETEKHILCKMERNGNEIQFKSLIDNAFVPDFNEKHHFDAMVGYEWQHFYRKGTSEYWGIYQETNLDPALRGTKYNHLTPDDNAWASESYLVSFFGRINYSALNRYMLTATVRGDGSSRFAPGRRWGVFPSVALGWKIKEESFLRDVHWLNDLKLRLGYGITGQQDLNMGDFPYMPTYDVSKQYAYATLGELATDEKKAELDAAGYVLDKDYVISSDNYIFYVHNRPNAYNPNLTWEKTTTYNVGIDFGFLNNRINGAIDYYYRVTDDLINYVTVPAGTNFKNSVTRNIGSLRNQGVEFSVNGVLVDKKNFKWDMSYNVTWNDNKITKLLDAEDENYYVPTGGIRNGQNVQAHKVGYAASSFYVYQTAKNETTGKLYVVDRNEDGKIDEKDKYFYHNPAAPVTMGLSSKWQFYGFDLGITFRASIGNYVYNHILSGNMQNIEASQIYSAKSGGFHNLMLTALQAYYVDGVNPSDYTSQLDLLDYFVENASFVRCDNITLGYSFEKQLKGRVYCTVSNPFVLSRYKGLDPEVFGGIDNNIYPRSLTVSVGTSLSF